jgi:IS30 family transposase
MKRKKQNNHFTIETRTIIEEELNQGASITNISKLLKRDRSNIGREIQKHRQIRLPAPYSGTCCCINKDSCTLRSYNCQSTCKNFEVQLCEKLKCSPHVCNGCPTKNGCRRAKYYYNARTADLQYQDSLTNSRKKLHYTELELNVLNNDFYCLVINTKSIYHSILTVNARGFNFNIKTIYRQIQNNQLRLKSFELPRYSKKSKDKKSNDTSYKREINGHTYEDYNDFKSKNPHAIEWQMDCVQGIQGKDEQVFLTLQIVEIKFIFIFIISCQTVEEVSNKLKQFRSYFPKNELERILEILLTDNGHEFINLEKLKENLPEKTNIFYCHPYSSFEKGSIENNHELIRRVIPQGVSLTPYTQNEINLLVSNINSLYRKELNGKCPFDLINNYISEEVIAKIGYQKIEPENVKLIPELLGEKNIMNIRKYLSDNDIKSSHILFKN